MLRILDALTQAGLITRAALSPEQRARKTALTGNGRKRLAAATSHLQQFEDLLVAQASPDHVPIVMAWLRTCAEQVSSQPLP
jgi:DNA-binding MarR family transcriptional regulator